jgi:hypothetical protein
MVEGGIFFMGARVGAHKKGEEFFPKDQKRSFGLEIDSPPGPFTKWAFYLLFLESGFKILM